jgi:hypothetical protein
MSFRPVQAAPRIAVVLVLSAISAVGACWRREPSTPPFATPGLAVNHDKAPLGSPLDVTYRFVVANDAHFAEDYRVMVHVVDTDEEMIFNFDHNPPVPTTQWKPGQTIEYTRTEFIPVYPYVGEASIQLGLYSVTTQKRLTLAGEDVGQKAYKVARLQLQPQTENVFTVFKEGWHPAEVAEHNATVEWQWTKKDALLAFKNPKKDCVFYFDVDNPGSVFHQSQHVQVGLGNNIVDEFTLDAGQSRLRKIPITAAQLGSGEMAEIHITVDKTFVPALLNASASKDPRELGVRVFHAYIDPR